MEAKAHDARAIQDWCINFVSRILDTPRDQVDPNVEVERLGLDSSTAVALIVSLEEWLGIELMPEMLFEYPTLSGLSRRLETLLPARAAEARP